MVVFIKTHNFTCAYDSINHLTLQKKLTILRKVYLFYLEGFQNMHIGKTLWLIILIKLFIMFAILKLFFFPNYLNTKFSDDSQREEHVREQIIHINN